MKCDIEYNGKLLHFSDTLPILSAKLSQLPSMFGITGIHKEIFPNKYYIVERLMNNNSKDGRDNSNNNNNRDNNNNNNRVDNNKNNSNNRATDDVAVGIINEAGDNEDKKWTEKDKQQFIENIDNIPGCRISTIEFNLWKYAEFYCQQDV